jgi:hypothetical protein
MEGFREEIGKMRRDWRDRDAAKSFNAPQRRLLLFDINEERQSLLSIQLHITITTNTTVTIRKVS